jgi:Flp pilus assembly protein TadD
MADATRNPDVLAIGAGGLAEFHLVSRSPHAARTCLERALEEIGTDTPTATPLLSVLAQAWLELRENDVASAVISEAVARATSEDNRLTLTDALRVEAMVLAQRGRVEQAAVRIVRGLELARSFPYPYAVARLLVAYGTMLAETGRTSEAEPKFAEAREIFERLGARRITEPAIAPNSRANVP